MSLLSKLGSIPQLLSGGYGILIRIALIALVCAGIWAWGATWGYQHEEAKLDVFHAQVDTIAQAAIKRSAEVKAAQDRTTKEVGDDYAKQLADLRAAPSRERVRVVFKPAGRGCVSAAAVSAKSPDGASGEPVVAGRPDGAGAAPEEVMVSQDFVLACAVDAAHVNGFRAFAEKNGFPAE